MTLLLLARRTKAAAKTAPRPEPRAERIHCPTCGKAQGFLLDLDGVSHRVLEDNTDTELLEEAALTELPTPVTCLACKRIYTAEETLAFAARESAEEDLAEGVVVARRTKGAFHGHAHRIRRVGPAAVRHTLDGRRVPVCPECGAMHGFFADIGGAAYRVLEDDRDTELLAEATNLMCPHCSAIFDFDP